MPSADLTREESVALAWALGELGCEPPSMAPRASNRVESQVPLFRRQAERGPFKLESVAHDQDDVVASFRNQKGQIYQLRLRLDDATLTAFAFGLAPPEGFVLREAHDRDIEQIAEIERDSPIETEDGRQFVIYRPRLRDFLRLQERNFKALIERDGKPVAARVFAWRSLKLRDGRTLAVVTSQVARVLPSTRGFNLMRCFGLWSSLVVAPQRDLVVAYVDPGNRVSNAAFLSEENEWRRHALELTLACATIADSGFGRAANPDDAGRLAELSNAAHELTALYGTQNEQSVRQKMERAPDVYSWGDVLISENAMLGVWRSLDETTDTAPGQAPKRRVLSVALDYGFAGEVGLGELLELVRAQAARAQSFGATHLTFYTYPGASVAIQLAPYADATAEIAIQVSTLPEPQDCEGLYTDPLYL